MENHQELFMICVEYKKDNFRKNLTFPVTIRSTVSRTGGLFHFSDFKF